MKQTHATETKQGPLTNQSPHNCSLSNCSLRNSEYAHVSHVFHQAVRLSSDQCTFLLWRVVDGTDRTVPQHPFLSPTLCWGTLHTDAALKGGTLQSVNC